MYSRRAANLLYKNLLLAYYPVNKGYQLNMTITKTKESINISSDDTPHQIGIEVLNFGYHLSLHYQEINQNDGDICFRNFDL